MTPAVQSDLAALLAAVLANPADDAPRLIYADWLRERGDESRAEFIAVQVELGLFERWQNDPGSGIVTPRGTDVDALRRREAELWPLVTDGIRASLGDLAPEGVYVAPASGPLKPPFDAPTYLVARGFVAAVALPLAAFMGHRECPEPMDPKRGLTSWGRYSHALAHTGCPRCGGTGRAPGVAAELFAANPITTVRLVDKRPAAGYPPSVGNHNDIHDGRPFWLSHPTPLGPGAQPHWLPKGLRLTGGVPVRPSRYSEAERRYYDTIERAEADLNQSLVAHGRGLAGLGPPPG